MDVNIIREKKATIPSLLREFNIDMWLTFVRESDTMRDPAMDLIIDRGVTWQSAFIFTKDGGEEVIVGSLDADNIRASGLYSTVKTYVGSIRDELRSAIEEIDPSTIAINRSADDVMSDGLTCGMYDTLVDILKGTPYVDRFTAADPIISAMRSRKTPVETEKIKRAVDITEEIYDRITREIRSGMTENDVADIVRDEIKRRGLAPAWDASHCPGIFAGAESAEAHAAPSDRVIEKGMVVHADFGVKFEGYCSDLQRTWYILKDDEEDAPEQVKKAFEALDDSIQSSFRAMRPGVEGRVIDKISRDKLIEHGFWEYPHALGHQVGRSTHDGAALLCPEWERYGERPYLKIEKGQIFTLEPRITLKEYGAVTMEEMVQVTDDGAVFLSRPQRKLHLIKRS